MTKKLKKVLAMLLAVSMVAGMLGTAAFAAENTDNTVISTEEQEIGAVSEAEIQEDEDSQIPGSEGGEDNDQPEDEAPVADETEPEDSESGAPTGEQPAAPADEAEDLTDEPADQAEVEDEPADQAEVEDEPAAQAEGEEEPVAPAADPVAQVGDTTYTSLQEAINSANSGDTVDLLKDITVDTWTQIWAASKSANAPKVAENVTIEGNNHTLTVNAITSNGNGNYLFYGAEALTVQNLTVKLAGPTCKGGFSLRDGSKLSNVTIDGGTYGVLSGSNVTIENCTFQNNGSAGYAIYTNESGTGTGVVITGCTFDSPRAVILRADEVFTGNTINGAKGVTTASSVSNVRVEGNTFNNARLDVYPITTGPATIEKNSFLGTSYVELENRTYSDPVDLSENYWENFDSTNKSTWDGNVVIASRYTDDKMTTLEVGEDAVAEVGGKYYSSLQAAIDNANSGDVVTLVNNATESVIVAEAQNIILAIPAGVTLTNAAGEHTIVNKGTLTITGEGTVDNVSNAKAALYNKGIIPEISGCTFTRSAENGTDYNKTDSDFNSHYTVRNAGTISKISGGVFENKGAYSSTFINGCYNSEEVGVIGEITGGTITGGKISLKNDPGGTIGNISGIVIEGTTIDREHSVTFIGLLNYGTVGTVTNSTITSSGNAVYSWSYYNDTSITMGAGVKVTGKNTMYAVVVAKGDHANSVTITDGEYYAVKPTGTYQTILVEEGAELKIYGGTFSTGGKAVLEQYAVGGYMAQQNADGTWSVVIDESKDVFVAKVGNVGYTTLQAAIEAAKAGETVTLIAEEVTGATGTEAIEITKEITLDLNGKKLTNRRFNIEKGGKLTINDGVGDGELVYTDPYGIFLKGGELVVNGGHIHGSAVAIGSNHADSIKAGVENTCTINGGTVQGAYVAIFWNVGTLTLNGGELVGATGVEVRSGSLEVPANSTVKVTGNGNCAVAPGFAYVSGSGPNVFGAGIAVDTYEETTVNIAGGEFSGYYALLDHYTSEEEKSWEDTINVTGGTFKVDTGINRNESFEALSEKQEAVYMDGNNVEIAISNGVFSTEVPAEYCAENYVPVQNANDTYGVILHTECDWDSGVVTTAPTYTTEGVRTYTCTVCGKTYTETIPVRQRPSTRPSTEEDEDLEDEETPLSGRPWMFVDVAEKDWFYEAVKRLFDKEIVGGTTETTYEPYTDATRGMVATILYGMAGSPSVEGLEMAFSDVAESDYYYNAVLWAYENGVFSGYPDGTFKGEQAIQRQELVAVLHRYGVRNGLEDAARADLSGFVDEETIERWAREDVEWAVAAGIMSGHNGNRLAPLDKTNRAEMAILLSNFDKLLNGEEE